MLLITSLETNIMEEYNIETLIKRYPELASCKEDIEKALNLLIDCFKNGNKLLIAGNGGSCADAEHIAGELMKGFKGKRPINKEFAKELEKLGGKDIAERLQQGLPTIALHNHNSLNTAFINDIDNGGLYFFAQQLSVYGNKGDVLLAISTSGNAKNIYNAALVAKAKGIKIIALTGQCGGILQDVADITIKAPSKETYIIQEYHLPIYHYLCLMLEKHFFKE